LVGKNATQLRKCITAIRRARVSGVSAGRNTGSIISVKFDRASEGRKELGVHHPRPRPYELRPWEAALFIECSWRLSEWGLLVTSSADAWEPEKSDYIDVQRLTGLVISNCQLRGTFFDLTITFDGGLRLDVFCDQVEEGEANYSIETYDAVCTVARNGQVIVAGKQPTRSHLTPL
jgi:hypothetical protein